MSWTTFLKKLDPTTFFENGSTNIFFLNVSKIGFFNIFFEASSPARRA
jgi:hypothetical protein